MPKFSLKGLWNGLFGESRYQLDDFPVAEERLQADQFGFNDVMRHGFPDRPTCLAYDPLQKLMAVGTNNGTLVIYGRRGVICHVQQDRVSAIVHIVFLCNDGALVTVCADGYVRLWSLRQTTPAVVRSLQFQRERVTSLLAPYTSRWLYIGTERANLHVLNIESFQLSGYIVYWNRAVPLLQKSHPGLLCCLKERPTDENKLLMGFAGGLVTLWNLKSNSAEQHWFRTATPPATSAATTASASSSLCLAASALTALQWRHDAKHFVTAHRDGALCTWHVKTPHAPVAVVYPHGHTVPGVLPDCEPIHNLLWLTSKNGEPLVVFSGGWQCDSPSAGLASVTLMLGDRVSVAEMESDVVDIVAVLSTPYTSEEQVASAVVVLLSDTVAVLELSEKSGTSSSNNNTTSAGSTATAAAEDGGVSGAAAAAGGSVKSAGCVVSLPFPHPHGLHLSPVTCCHLASNCSSQLLADIGQTVAAAGGGGGGGGGGGRLCQQASANSTSCEVSGERRVNDERASGGGEAGGDDDGGWPVNGGVAGCAVLPTDAVELLITGHADGTIRFWNVSGAQFVLLNKIRTTRALQKHKPSENQVVLGEWSDPLAITSLLFCPLSRTLVACGAACHIIVYQFSDKPVCAQVSSVEIAWPIDENSVVSGGGGGGSDGRRRSSSPAAAATASAASGDSGGRDCSGRPEWPQQASVELAEAAADTALGTATTASSCDISAGDRPASPLASSPPLSPTPATPSLPPDVVPVWAVQCRRSAQRFAAGFQPLLVCTPAAPSIREYTSGLYSVPKSIDALTIDTETAVVCCASGANVALVDTVGACCLLVGSAKQLHSPYYWRQRRKQLLHLVENPCSRRSSAEGLLSSLFSLSGGDSVTDSSVSSCAAASAYDCTSASSQCAAAAAAAGAAGAGAGAAAGGAAGAGGGAAAAAAGAGGTRRSSLFSAIGATQPRSSSSSVSAATAATAAAAAAAVAAAGDEIGDVVDTSTVSHVTALAFTQMALVSPTDTNKGGANGGGGHVLRLLIGCHTGQVRLLQLAAPAPLDPAVPWEAGNTGVDSVQTVRVFGGSDGESVSSILSMTEIILEGSSAKLVPPSGDWCKLRRLESVGCDSATECQPSQQQQQHQQQQQQQRLLLVVGTAACVRVLVLPSGSVFTSRRVSERARLSASWVIDMNGVGCLVCFSTDGWLTALCLPSLRPLLTVYLRVMVDPVVLSTLSVSHGGSGVFLHSPSEIQKFTISAENGRAVDRRRSLLFVARGAPERPSRGFVQALFGKSRDLDRDQLFGPSAGHARHGTVQAHFNAQPSTSATASAAAGGTNSLLVHSVSAGGAVGAAYRQAVERGDKLSQLAERTERLQMSATAFSSSSHQLAEKYRNKKWWQL